MSKGFYLSKQQAEYSRLCGRLIAAPTVLTINTASNGLPAALTAGSVYRIVASCDAWYLQCNGGTVTQANAHFLPARTIEFLPVLASAINIVAVGSAAGNVWISRLA